MTFKQKEDSLYEGSPIDLYKFVLGGKTYLFTSSDAVVNVGLSRAENIHIKHTNIKSSSNKKKSGVDIELPLTLDLAQTLLHNPPDAVLEVTIMRKHDGDDQWYTYWRGNGSASKETGDKTVVLECQNLVIATERSGLRTKYGKTCGHSLYDQSDGSCRVNINNYTFSKTVSKQESTKLTINNLMTGVNTPAKFASNYFVGGKVVVGNKYERYIEAQNGNVLTLTSPIPEIKAGGTVSIIAGCDRNYETCRLKFSNNENYGGFPTIPTKNPFAGDAIV